MMKRIHYELNNTKNEDSKQTKLTFYRQTCVRRYL